MAAMEDLNIKIKQYKEEFVKIFEACSLSVGLSEMSYVN